MITENRAAGRNAGGAAGGWLLIGMVIYFAYSRHQTALERCEGRGTLKATANSHPQAATPAGAFAGLHVRSGAMTRLDASGLVLGVVAEGQANNMTVAVARIE